MARLGNTACGAPVYMQSLGTQNNQCCPPLSGHAVVLYKCFPHTKELYLDPRRKSSMLENKTSQQVTGTAKCPCQAQQTPNLVRRRADLRSCRQQSGTLGQTLAVTDHNTFRSIPSFAHHGIRRHCQASKALLENTPTRSTHALRSPVQSTWKLFSHLTNCTIRRTCLQLRAHCASARSHGCLCRFPRHP